MELIQQFIDMFLNLDTHLTQWATWLGPWLYVLLFAIIFCETGLVVTPFLPGDSLLFAVGALAAIDGSPIMVGPIIVLLIVAGVLGDATNYAIGHYVGPKVFNRKDSFWFHQEHLARTQKFYEKYGGKTIIFARFIPIIRTFAPFVAGIGKMKYRQFAAFNVIGGILWVVSFTLGGYFFGNIPAIKSNFHYVIVGIIVVSFMPPIIELFKAKMEAKRASKTIDTSV